MFVQAPTHVCRPPIQLHQKLELEMIFLLQVAGHDEGWRLMEAADPLLLLVSLPLIPIGLFLGKMVRWQDPVLKVIFVI